MKPGGGQGGWGHRGTIVKPVGGQGRPWAPFGCPLGHTLADLPGVNEVWNTLSAGIAGGQSVWEEWGIIQVLRQWVLYSQSPQLGAR